MSLNVLVVAPTSRNRFRSRLNNEKSNELDIMVEDVEVHKRDHEAEERANAEIARDCANIGVKIESPWDFTGGKNGALWSDAVAEVFARHLSRPHPRVVLEGLMFAGSWLETKDMFLVPVLRILRENGKNFLGQAAANALLRMMQPGDEALMESLILDQAVGSSRALLVPGFAKRARKTAIHPLRSLVKDKDVRNVVLKELAKLGDQTVRGELVEAATHSDPYVRKIGRDGIARLDKRLARLPGLR